MRLDKAEVQLRVGVSSFADYIYGSTQQLGLPVRRLYKSSSHDGLTVCIPLPTVIIDGTVVSVDESDLLKARQIVNNLLSNIFVKLTVLVVVHFSEDESDFSIAPNILIFSGEHGANLWIYTYPKGDWTEEE